MTLQPTQIYNEKAFPIEKVLDPRKEKITRTTLLSEHATSSFLLTHLYESIFGRPLRIEHSLGDGLFYVDEGSKGERGFSITEEMRGQLEESFKIMIENDEPITITSMKREDLLSHFRKKSYKDKIELLKIFPDEDVEVIKFGEFIDYLLEPTSTDKSRLKIFEIKLSPGGIILRFPTMTNPHGLKEFKDPKVIHEMFHEYEEWAKTLNVDNCMKLNQKIFDGTIKKTVLISEGLHERKLAAIASSLCRDSSNRVITVAGPSSSNKTTFAKR
jgi:hypothetical protein